MSSTMRESDLVPVLRGGKWATLRSDRFEEVVNPSTGQVIARIPLCPAKQTAEVVEAAAQALPDWSNTPVVDRARTMFRLRELLVKNRDELVALVTREHGKPLSELFL